MAKRMLAAAEGTCAALFETAGPGCVRAVPEGKMSCGKPSEVRREIAALGKGRRLMPPEPANSSSAARRSSRE